MGVISGIGGSTLLVIGSAFGVAVFAFWLLMKEIQRDARRPFSGRPLRPPGESLRIKVGELEEKLLFRLMLSPVVIFPTAIICESAVKFGNTPLAIGTGSIGLALMLGIILWAWQAVKFLMNYRLGFDGERAVGEELNRLMLDGCQVFHDLQMDGIGNIDHVVVAPHAVFAIETKAKRKRKPKGSDEYDHRVTFTGDEMVYPFGKDRKDLKQVRRNANVLAKKLEQLTKESVTVKSVLVLPGWLIERTGKSDVAVVNDKQSQLQAAIVDRRAQPMDGKQRERICAQLEDWSRQSMEK